MFFIKKSQELLTSKRLIWLILGLALLLRLPHINGSFWLDEAAQAIESSRPFTQQFDITPDFQPPLLHLLLFVAVRFSRAEWWLRLIGALIPGLITIWGTYELGRLWKMPKAGLLAALLLATNSLHIFFSQELRQYSLPAMWAIVSQIALWHLLQAKQPLFGRWWWLLTLSTAAGLYTSYLFPFFVLGQVAFALVAGKKHWQAIAGALCSGGLLFLPWLPSFLAQLQTGTALRSQLPGWDSVVSFTQAKSLGLVVGKFLFGVIDLSLAPTLVITTAIVGAILAFLGWKAYQDRADLQKRYLQEWLLATWLTMPLLTAWLVSFAVPVIQPKRVLYLLPGFYLWLAIRVLRLSSRSALLIIGLFLAANLFGTWQYYTIPQYQREDWRSLHQELVARFPVGQSIAVFAFPEPFAPWRWYDNGEYATLASQTLYLSPGTDTKELLKPATRYPYIVVFEYLTDLTDPADTLITGITAFGYHEIAILERPNIGFVRVYSQPGYTLSAAEAL